VPKKLEGVFPWGGEERNFLQTNDTMGPQRGRRMRRNAMVWIERIRKAFTSAEA